MLNLTHNRSCNCQSCISFRRGVIEKDNDTRAQVRMNRRTRATKRAVEQAERRNGVTASFGGTLRTSLGVALLDALK